MSIFSFEYVEKSISEPKMKSRAWFFRISAIMPLYAADCLDCKLSRRVGLKKKSVTVLGPLGTKIAALLIKKQMREIKAKLSGDAKGGAILLGLRGVVLIGHGATSVEAVKNGTLAAAEAVRAGLVENVANSMDGIVL